MDLARHGHHPSMHTDPGLRFKIQRDRQLKFAVRRVIDNLRNWVRAALVQPGRKPKHFTHRKSRPDLT